MSNQNKIKASNPGIPSPLEKNGWKLHFILDCLYLPLEEDSPL